MHKLERIELLLTMTPKQISEYFRDDEKHHLQFTDNEELIGISTHNEQSRLYYGKRDKGVLTRIIYLWNTDKWNVESKVSG